MAIINRVDENDSFRRKKNMVAMRRELGVDGLEVSAMGLGCWAIGGPFAFDGRPAGWGEVDDDESVRAIRRALELGLDFFDTADVYGCGHSEWVLGRALEGRRNELPLHLAKKMDEYVMPMKPATGAGRGPFG